MTPERMREIASRRGSTSGVRWDAVQQQDGEWVIEDETGRRIADRIKRDADAHFIVHARGLDIPDLLGELAAAVAQVEQLRAGILQPWPAGGYMCVVCQGWGESRETVEHKACALTDEARAALAGQTAATPHVVECSPSEFGSWVVCSCGWKLKVRGSVFEAEQAADEHLAGQTAAPVAGGGELLSTCLDSMQRTWSKAQGSERAEYKQYIEMGDILFHATNGQQGACGGYSGPPCEAGE